MKNNNPNDLNRKLTVEEYDLLRASNSAQQTTSTNHAGSLTINNAPATHNHRVAVAAPTAPITITNNNEPNHITSFTSPTNTRGITIGASSKASLNEATVASSSGNDHLLRTPTRPTRSEEQSSLASSAIVPNDLFSTPQHSRTETTNYLSISPSNLDFTTSYITQYISGHNLLHSNNPIINNAIQGNMLTFRFQDGTTRFERIFANNAHHQQYNNFNYPPHPIYDDEEEERVFDEEINYSDDESEDESDYGGTNQYYVSRDSETEDEEQEFPNTSHNGRQITIEEAFARHTKRSRDDLDKDQTDEDTSDTSSIENDETTSKKSKTDSESSLKKEETSEEEVSSEGSESPIKTDFQLSGEIEGLNWDSEC